MHIFFLKVNVVIFGKMNFKENAKIFSFFRIFLHSLSFLTNYIY